MTAAREAPPRASLGLSAAAALLCACSGCTSDDVRYYDSGPRPDSAPPADGGGGDGGGDGGGGDASGGPVCNPAFAFGAASAVPGVAAGDKTFGAVTPDELTLAWVTPAGSVLYADRTASSQPFGGAQTLSGTYAPDRVALSADGLTLIVVMQGAASLGQVKRTARGQAFSGAPDTAPFANLRPGSNPEDGGGGMGMLGDPVLSADGQLLFFSSYGTGAMGTVCVSSNSGTKWTKPDTLSQLELLATSDTVRRRPSGLSSDGRTLFFWDDVDGKEKAAWRKTNTSYDLAFSGFVDLADRKGAQPAAACTRLYFTNPVTSPSDVKLADKQ